MRSRILLAVASVVVLVVGTSVAIGMTRPDGRVGDIDASAQATAPTPTSTPTTPTPTPAPTVASPDPNLAPVAVAGTWPGRPDAAVVEGDEVDWCPAVSTEASSAATSALGREQVDAAACAAVSFVLDHRYSRLAIPRPSYRASDFDSVLSSIAAATRDTFYRPRVSTFVRQPSTGNAERLGLVLFRGGPGSGYRFYGPADSTKGYADRAVWINPTFSKVRASLGTGRSVTRVVTSFTAAAAVPVFDTGAGTDAMMVVPTRASITVRKEGGGWKVSAFDLYTGPASFDALDVR